jgi:signal transduction histidine kinase
MNRAKVTQPIDDRDKLLDTLEQLLALPAIDTQAILNQASQLLSEAMHADKIDAFLYNSETDTLVAIGISDTPMGAHQRQVGLNLLPLSNGGREAEVYRDGGWYLSGNVDLDIGVLPGFRHALGIRSMIIVPLNVDRERRGVIQVATARSEAFSPHDVRFVEAVAHWIGMIVHRSELAERITAAAAEEARRQAAGELVTALAHDLNNYLTPIRGRMALLRRRATQEERPQDVADLTALAQAVDRLGSLITDLLDMERIEQGLFGVTLGEVALDGLVDEVVTTLSSPDTPIVLHVREQEQALVLADPARLRQALENLLANATHHAPRGVAVIVTLEVEQRAEGHWSTVRVHDDGPGVPADMVPRLFTRFATGPGSTGLGLGLFMARSIAEAHGGTLTYDPDDSGGATFRLALPFAGSGAINKSPQRQHALEPSEERA